MKVFKMKYTLADNDRVIDSGFGGLAFYPEQPEENIIRFQNCDSLRDDLEKVKETYQIDLPLVSNSVGIYRKTNQKNVTLSLTYDLMGKTNLNLHLSIEYVLADHEVSLNEIFAAKDGANAILWIETQKHRWNSWI